MAYERYLIAPFTENSGLNTSLKPWQIPDEAWATLDNMYVFRGRIRKRFGSKYMGASQLNSRLRIQVGTIGSPTSPVPGNVFEPGQMFSAGSQIFTVYQTGTPADMLATGPGSGTFNTSTGAFVLSGTGLGNSTPIYFYPATPVMGLTQYEFASINNFPTIAFDTRFAYIYSGGAWALSAGSPTWNGNDTNFFWTYNWVGVNAAASALTRALFVSNFQVTNPNGAGEATDDPIYYYNNSTWTAYTPYINPAGGSVGSGPFVQTALLIVPFHDRLVILNTIENDGGDDGGTNTNYVNRARYTSQGSPFEVNAWYGVGAYDGAGNTGVSAGFEDASTLEAIVSAQFVKDRLIVYFEESTWELTFVGNDQRPFEWQRLNSELGSMATQSTISFDKAILTVGETGIHSCNGSNVVRIDDKIPSQIFMISNPSTETERICGIRDYYNEMVYWSIPLAKQPSTQPYPSQVLVYNYQNETWAFNDDAVTAFGYFDGGSRPTWATLTGTWEQWNTAWNAGEAEAQTREIIMGNQEGFVTILATDQSGESRNAGALSITNLVDYSSLPWPAIQLTIYNHMLFTGDYIYIENAQGVVLAGQKIYVVFDIIDGNNVVVTYPESVINSTNPPTEATFTGTYTGGGTAARVSNYNLYSKQWNPYDKDGRNVYVAKIDFFVDSTTYGQVTVDYSPSSASLSTLTEAQATACIMGTGILETSPYALYPLEFLQQRLVHPVYFQSDGECIQINIYMSDLQICNPKIAFSDFEIEGLVLHTQPTAARLE